MIPPLSSVHAVEARPEVHHVADVKPDPRAQTPPVQKSGQVSEDQVTLKSAGQPDPDR